MLVVVVIVVVVVVLHFPVSVSKPGVAASSADARGSSVSFTAPPITLPNSIRQSAIAQKKKRVENDTTHLVDKTMGGEISDPTIGVQALSAALGLPRDEHVTKLHDQGGGEVDSALCNEGDKIAHDSD